jgi:hypothetical protein
MAIRVTTDAREVVVANGNPAARVTTEARETIISASGAVRSARVTDLAREVIVQLGTYSISVADQVAVTDAVQIQIVTPGISATDQTTVTDVVNVQISSPGIIVSDQVTVTDAVTIERSFIPVPSGVWMTQEPLELLERHRLAGNPLLMGQEVFERADYPLNATLATGFEFEVVEHPPQDIVMSQECLEVILKGVFRRRFPEYIKRRNCPGNG